MKTEVSAQLQRYGDYLDATAGHVDVERIEELADRAVLQTLSSRGPRRGWAVTAAAAVATLLIIGGVAVLQSDGSTPAAGAISPFYARVETSNSIVGVSMVYEIWYQGEAGWRITSLDLEGSGEFMAPGSFELWTGDQLGEYNADTNRTSTDPGYHEPLGDLGLAADGFDNFTEECQPLGTTRLIGRTVHGFACVDEELWFDDSSGLILRRQGVLAHEILELELNPDFPADIFVFDLPSDARDQTVFEGIGFEHRLVGQPAPPLAGALLGGGSFDLADSPDRPTVVTFWYSACQPCLNQLDVLHTVSATRTDITFVTALVDEAASEAQPVINERGYTLPVIDTPASQTYQGEDRIVVGVPTTVLINPDGTIAAVFYGSAPDAASLEAYFDQAGW